MIEITMKFTPLSTEQRQQFEQQGFLILRQVLDQDKVERLVAAGNKLVASDLQENRQATADGFYDGFRNCLALDDTFISLLTYDRTVPLIVQLLGPRIHLVTSHLIYKRPNAPGTPTTYRTPGWHEDGGNMARDLNFQHIPRAVIKCAYCLTDLSQPHSGATLFAPGSHLLTDAQHKPWGQNDPEEVFEPLLQPGDAVLFENRTYHAGAPNLQDQQCKMVMFGYGYQWIKEFDYAQQPAELVDKVDDIGKQLLGALRGPDGNFVPGGISAPLEQWYKQYCA